MVAGACSFVPGVGTGVSMAITAVIILDDITDISSKINNNLPIP